MRERIRENVLDIVFKKAGKSRFFLKEENPVKTGQKITTNGKNGTITAVTDDTVEIKFDDGSTTSVPLSKFWNGK